MRVNSSFRSSSTGWIRTVQDSLGEVTKCYQNLGVPEDVLLQRSNLCTASQKYISTEMALPFPTQPVSTPTEKMLYVQARLEMINKHGAIRID